MKYTTSDTDAPIKISIEIESDGCGVILVNSIDIIRLTSSGSIAIIRSGKQKELHLMGFIADDEGRVHVIE